MTGLRDMLKTALNLVAVYVTGGIVLAVVYVATNPVILKNASREKELALQRILPDAGAIKKQGEWVVHGKHAEYFIAEKNGAVCGRVIETYGKGYSGLIHMLCAVDTGLTVQRIAILSHGETPGLGDEIESSWFKNQFAGKHLGQMKVSKLPGTTDIQAISGATISSRAVTEDAVKSALVFLAQSQPGGPHHGSF